jgi:hypothetical protein
MPFAVFASLFSVLLDLLGLLARSERETTLEILLLRGAAAHLATDCHGPKLVHLAFPGGRNCR